MHLTLAFQGDTSDEDIPRIIKMLHQLAARHSPFVFTLKGAGFFGSSANPSVLWAGISPDSDLPAIQADIVKDLQSLGLQTDTKPFSPHLTIGRIKAFKSLPVVDTFMSSYKSVELQETDVREIIYYESILTSGGPLYKALGRFQLSGH
jgi:2'-5' RNA ligase